MNAPQKSGFRFEPEWRITLVTVLLVPLMVGLGFWQLQRAQEKAQIQQVNQQRLSAAPVPLEQVLDLEDSALAYRAVTLTGEYLPGTDFLLDNRIYKGRFGYEVLSPFRLQDGGQVVLVNRGWVAGDPGRRSLPAVPTVSGEQRLVAQVYVPPGKPYTLGDSAPQAGWPKVVQVFDASAMAPQLSAVESVFGHLLRLGEGQAGALEIDWQVVNVSPEKHTGYAVQWFTMAAVLALIYILRSTNLRQLYRGSPGQDG